MRSFLAGLTLVLSVAASAMAGARGEVVAMGFENRYRPDCWTPLLIQLNNDASTAANYMVQVHQLDIDKDTVVYTRVVTLNANAKQQKFWAYFVPQPVGPGPNDLGLPSSAKELGEQLKVYLYDEAGKAPIATLPITFGAGSVDPPRITSAHGHGRKFVLCVLGEEDKVTWSEYESSIGLMEDVQFVPVTTEALPESVLGYQGVDAIIWLGGNTKAASAGGSPAVEAVRQYVKQGGQLVVCQPAVREHIVDFVDAGMLPVVAKQGPSWLDSFRGRARPNLQPLVTIAQADSKQLNDMPVLERYRNWDRIAKSGRTFEMFQAAPTPDAVVDAWIDWNDDQMPGDPAPAAPSAGAPSTRPASAERSPYIARKMYGLGTVTWVAHNLGDPSLMFNQARGRPAQARGRDAFDRWLAIHLGSSDGMAKRYPHPGRPAQGGPGRRAEARHLYDVRPRRRG